MSDTFQPLPTAGMSAADVRAMFLRNGATYPTAEAEATAAVLQRKQDIARYQANYRARKKKARAEIAA